MLLQDHGLRNNSKLKLWNYSVIQQNKTNELHDGTAIAIRKDLKYTEESSFIEEMQAINLLTSRGNITIATAYQPPRRSHLLREDFTKLFRRCNPTFLLADLNARCRESGYRSPFNQQGRNLKTFIQDGLCSRIGPDFATFITARSATTPDIVLTNNAGLPNYWIRQGNPTSSDHQTILMELSWAPIQIPIKPKKLYKKANWQLYQDMMAPLSEIDITNGEHISVVEKALEEIQSTIKKADLACIPRSTHRTLPHPNYSATEREMIKRLSELNRLLANHTATPQEWTQLKRLQVQLNQACKVNSRLSWDKKIQTIQNFKDPNKFWKQIKTVMGSDPLKKQFIFNNTREKIHKPDNQEPIFREFWKKMYEEKRDQDQLNKAQETIAEVAINLRDEDITPERYINLERSNTLLFTEEEVQHSINSFQQKAPGWDEVTKIHLTKAKEHIIGPLTKCFNAALSCGYFPDLFKRTKMIFAPKPGKDSAEVMNYRPISLLSIIGKLLEKLLNRWLTAHLQENH